MKGRVVIWDLDQTLVDSRSIEPLRKRREWGRVMAKLDFVVPYIGLRQIVDTLQASGVASVVVTSSPRHYAEAVLTRHYPSVATVVGYHDSKNHKPHPDPIRCGLARVSAEPTHSLSIGDAHTDILASRAAGVPSVGATWGAVNPDELLRAKPDSVVHTAAELQALLQQLGFMNGLS